MYTGITQGMFPISNLHKKPGLISFTVKLNDPLVKNLTLGASVSVDGVCLTVVAIDGTEVSFDVIAETCAKTTLANIQAGQNVSIERSAVYGAEIGGHAMFGHIYGMGEIVNRCATPENLQLTIRCSPEMMQYIFAKGFIGVNGSSLTVNALDLNNNSFAINLIPHTLAVTDFANKQMGDKVNLELDANVITIVETIKRLKLNQFSNS